MKKHLFTSALSFLLIWSLFAGIHTAAAVPTPDTEAATTAITLPLWNENSGEEITEQETETETETEIETEAVTEAEEPALLDSEHLKEELLALHLKYGMEFTFAMLPAQIPETEEEAKDTFPRYSFRYYLELRNHPLPPQPRSILNLEKHLTELMEPYRGNWSVYIKNLTTGDTLAIHDQPMKSASIMKLFIMATVYDAMDRKELERTSEILDLMTNMISYSSNEAANRLLSRLGGGDLASGIQRVNQYIRMHGYSDMTHEYNGFQDANTIVDHQHFNQLSAKDCGILLEKVYHRTLGSRKICSEIEEMMLKQQTRYKIPKGLPDGVTVGNKTGEMDTVENDVAVIYGEKSDYILCVLSNDWNSKDEAQRHIQEISSAVYRFFDDERYYLLDESYRILTLPAAPAEENTEPETEKETEDTARESEATDTEEEAEDTKTESEVTENKEADTETESEQLYEYDTEIETETGTDTETGTETSGRPARR